MPKSDLSTENIKEENYDDIDIDSKDIEETKKRLRKEWQEKEIKKTELSFWQSIVAIFKGEDYVKKCKQENFAEKLSEGIIKPPSYSDAVIKSTAIKNLLPAKLQNTRQKKAMREEVIQQEKEAQEAKNINKKLNDLLKEKDICIQKFQSSLDVNESDMSLLTDQEKSDITRFNDKINIQYQKIETLLKQYAENQQQEEQPNAPATKDEDSANGIDQENDQEKEASKANQKPTPLSFEQFSIAITDLVDNPQNGLKALVDKREKVLQEYLENARKEHRDLDFNEQQKTKEDKKKFFSYLNNYRQHSVNSKDLYNKNKKEVQKEVNISLGNMDKSHHI